MLLQFIHFLFCEHSRFHVGEDADAAGHFEEHGPLNDIVEVFAADHLSVLEHEGGVPVSQRINYRFKEIKFRYGLKIRNFSTHSMRKTLGRKVVESAGPNAEMALIRLSEMYNHSSPQVTRRYLGLRQQELAGVYDALDF